MLIGLHYGIILSATVHMVFYTELFVTASDGVCAR